MPAAQKMSKNLFLAENYAHHVLSHSKLLHPQTLGPVRGFISLDEVGRGCLAGPVVAGVSAWIVAPQRQGAQAWIVAPQRQGAQAYLRWLDKVRDSKKLSQKMRDMLFARMGEDFPHLFSWTPETDFEKNSNGLDRFEHRQLQVPQKKALKCAPPSRHNLALSKVTPSEIHPSELHPAEFNPAAFNEVNFECVAIELGASTAQEIDAHNIWQAAQLAMGRALLKLLGTQGSSKGKVAGTQFEPTQFALLVDGSNGILVPPAFALCAQLTAVGGDDLFVSVGLSSIAAKVARDQFMTAQAQIYPAYGFGQHKGYATKTHIEAIKTHHTTHLHRHSFLKNILQSPLFNEEYT